jgi:hypothetical protein
MYVLATRVGLSRFNAVSGRVAVLRLSLKRTWRFQANGLRGKLYPSFAGAQTLNISRICDTAAKATDAALLPKLSTELRSHVYPPQSIYHVIDRRLPAIWFDRYLGDACLVRVLQPTSSILNITAFQSICSVRTPDTNKRIVQRLFILIPSDLKRLYQFSKKYVSSKVDESTSLFGA